MFTLKYSLLRKKPTERYQTEKNVTGCYGMVPIDRKIIVSVQIEIVSIISSLMNTFCLSGEK